MIKSANGADSVLLFYISEQDFAGNTWANLPLTLGPSWWFMLSIPPGVPG